MQVKVATLICSIIIVLLVGAAVVVAKNFEISASIDNTDSVISMPKASMFFKKDFSVGLIKMMISLAMTP